MDTVADWALSSSLWVPSSESPSVLGKLGNHFPLDGEGDPLSLILLSDVFLEYFFSSNLHSRSSSESGHVLTGRLGPRQCPLLACVDVSSGR